MPTDAANLPRADMGEPGNANDYCRRGWSLYVQGDYEQAGADFKQALLMEPDAVDGHYGMGLLLKARGNVKEATEHFSKVIELVDKGLMVEDRVRGSMLRHLSKTHLNHLKPEDWQAP